MVLVWVATTGLCSVEHLLSHSESAGEHDAAPSPTDSGHSHDSDKHDGDQHSCCDSPKIVQQFAQTSLLAKPDFGKTFSFATIWLAQALTPIQPDAAPFLRHAIERDGVFTPEVCLGPAHRSHAPPFFA